MRDDMRLIEDKNGEPGEIIGCWIDITHRKEMDSLTIALRDLGLALSGAADLKQGLEMCLDAAIAVSNMDSGGIYLLDEKTGALELIVSKGLSGEFTGEVSHLDAHTPNMKLIMEGRPVFTVHARVAATMTGARRREGLRAIGVVPIRHESLVIGAINVASHTADEVPEFCRNGLETLAVQIGNAVARLRGREALRREHELVSAITESSPVGIVVAGSDGRIRFANAAAEKTLGLTRENIRGRTFNDPAWRICAPDGKEFPDEGLPFSIVKRTGRPVSGVRHAIELPGGRRVQLLINAAPLTGAAGEFEGMVASLEDITDRIKAGEELERVQRLESLGLLAGGIAHDFNNLMGGMFGYVDMAREFCIIDEQAHSYLDSAMQAYHKAKALTMQLLTFSKGGAPVKKFMALEPCLHQNALLAASGSNIRCSFELAPQLWHVEADEGQIGQVISNIVINARQAMPTGGVVKICAENMELKTGDPYPVTGGRYVKVTISDNGPGIAFEHLSHLFDPFFTTKQMGSGLGLSIAHSVLKKHGGHIQVESSLGNGATFTLFIPTSSSRAEMQGSEPERAVRAGGRVLVMDDEELVREMAGDMLQNAGFEVCLCANGDEAVELYKRAMSDGRPFALVILDLTIPGGRGGADTVQELLSLDPRACAVVSSGYADDPVCRDFARHGFRGVVVKPYRIEDLMREIGRIQEQG
jgi:PAS domain S-box-containing protein